MGLFLQAVSFPPCQVSVFRWVLFCEGKRVPLTKKVESLEAIAQHNRDLLKRLLALFERSLCQKDISHKEMLGTINKRFDQIEKSIVPNAVRGAGTLSSASIGGKTRSAKYEPCYEEAREFIREYHEKHPSVSFTQARKRAAHHLALSLGTLRSHIKKEDFADW
ncbi:hypothetical protein [Tichowtungia aerotolerans]|uniref:Uncharacterized protein n=1 Tax=Tichowtungia aerotolerans TaxID=2697043 RepID=A0A6P1MAN6_9BACT|nr:hypothetical protein [Tichowtungia aerotolerans]QHI70163.1 hypothetical protein GT409_12140 [Tichowtungia aerotolerans]